MFLLCVGMIILTVILRTFCNHYQNVKRFRDAGVIFKEPLPFVGNLGSALIGKGNMMDLIGRTMKINPEAKYVGFFELSTPVIILSDIDLMKSITVKNFDHFRNRIGIIDKAHDPVLGLTLLSLKDETWKKVRQTMNPLFASGKLRNLFHLMSECAKGYATILAEQSPEKSVMEMKDLASAYAHDIVASFAFGIRIDSLQNPGNDFYTLAKKATRFDVRRSLVLLFTRRYPVLSRRIGVNILEDKLRNLCFDTIKRTIREREEKGITRPDVIQLMMDLRKDGNGNTITNEELIAQAFVFYVAGIDSVATLLTFVAYRLLMHPDVYEKLQLEIDSMNVKRNGNPTYDDVKDLVYLDAVINETLRFNTPVSHFDRVCSKDFELPPAVPGGKPYLMRKGDLLFVSPQAFHRNPKYFEDPDTFKPERFLEGDERLSSRPAFFPFGNGPRICIGQRLTILESKMFFFHLLSKCQLSMCPKTPRGLVLRGITFSFIIEGGMWLDIRAREDKSPEEHNGIKNRQS